MQGAGGTGVGDGRKKGQGGRGASKVGLLVDKTGDIGWPDLARLGSDPPAMHIGCECNYRNRACLSLYQIGLFLPAL